jgi:hypothetical protein
MVKKRNIQEITAVDEPVAMEDANPSETNIRRNLDQIRNENSVIGYIMRNSTSAAIDLKDPTKIVEYALFSSSAFDASQELASFLTLGEIRHIEVETKRIKALSLVIDETKVSLFMEKGADSIRFLRKLSSI